MASLDNMKKPPAEEPGNNLPKASKVEQLDLEIAVKLGHKLMKEAGGLQAVEQAIKGSGDPIQAISKFLVQLIMQIKEVIEKQGVELSPSIVLGQGGWVMQMLDLLEEELGLPRDFSDQVLGDVMETFKAMAQSQDQEQQQPAPQEGANPQAAPAGQPLAPPPPQGAPPNGGMM